MQYSTQQIKRRFPSLIPHESKKLPCMGVVFVETYRPPQILLRICLLISVLFVVLHNSFIFSLVFVMCFSVLHLHILLIFVLCFCRCSKSRFRLLQYRNFQVCEISQPAKFCVVAKFSYVHCSSSSLFVFYNLSFPAQYINFSRLLSPSFNTHL